MKTVLGWEQTQEDDMGRFPYELLPEARQKLSDEELRRLAAGFAKSRPFRGPDKDGVSKDVLPKMMKATVDAFAKRK